MRVEREASRIGLLEFETWLCSVTLQVTQMIQSLDSLSETGGWKRVKKWLRFWQLDFDLCRFATSPGN